MYTAYTQTAVRALQHVLHTYYICGDLRRLF